MAALDLLDGWNAPNAAAVVVGGDGRGVLAAKGDTGAASRWASITKMVTALATLVAVEEGTVGLDDAAGPPGSTVRHLLAHASGLAFQRDRVLVPPGRRRIYSNVGYEALGGVVATRCASRSRRTSARRCWSRSGWARPGSKGRPRPGSSAPWTTWRAWPPSC